MLRVEKRPEVMTSSTALSPGIIAATFPWRRGLCARDRVMAPGWFAGIPGAESLLDAGHHGLTSSCAQLALEGTATVSSDDLASAAQAGLTVPDGSSRAGAWRAAADAILHRRLGGVVPAWAGGQEAAIDAAADRVAGFDAVRLRGFVGVGAGGTLSGAAVGRVSGTAQVATRIEIDRPASDADRATLRRVVVGP